MPNAAQLEAFASELESLADGFDRVAASLSDSKTTELNPVWSIVAPSDNHLIKHKYACLLHRAGQLMVDLHEKGALHVEGLDNWIASDFRNIDQQGQHTNPSALFYIFSGKIVDIRNSFGGVTEFAQVGQALWNGADPSPTEKRAISGAPDPGPKAADCQNHSAFCRTLLEQIISRRHRVRAEESAAVSKKPRVPHAEANGRAQAMLMNAPPKGKEAWTVRDLANAIGVSNGSVGNLPAFIAYQAQHGKTSSRRHGAAVRFSANIQNSVADQRAEAPSEIAASNEELARLVAEQKADLASEGRARRPKL